MKLLSYERNGARRIGALRGEQDVIDLTGPSGCTDLGEALRKMGAQVLRDLAEHSQQAFPLAAVDAYRPAVADPSRIVCVGLNYEEHRVEAGRARTAQPSVFLRLPSSQTGHLQPIVLAPEMRNGLDYEGEIAVVIGRGGRRIKPEQAFSHVLGFAPYNDASARDWQAHSTQWTAGKNFPATGAFGPFIVTADAIGEDRVLSLTTRLNGEVLQHADTSMMIFPIPELIAYVSTFTELEPGDVIVTGTPGGVGFKRTPPVLMKAGDLVEVEVSDVGTLRNTIALEAG
jgi:2-keto-4-pentenoate hydratase/2-oxohepta-3-ene-1,7-dioic acid hydratase in catechol pathway